MKNILLMSLIAAGAIVGGCSQEAKNDAAEAGAAASTAAAKGTEAVATDVQKGTEAVAEGAQEAGAAVVNGAQAAGEAVANTAENAAEAVDNKAMTARVKSAIVNAKDIDSSEINVDTLEGNKVVLRGAVKDEAQKKQVEMLAKTTAGKDYTIVNQLTTGKM